MLICFLLLLLVPGISLAQPLKLWCKQPARNWNDAMPAGSGRLGAMISGKVDEELLQRNEGILWSGGRVNPHPNPTAPTYLPQIRETRDAVNLELATTLTKKMQGLYTESHEPQADLLVCQPFSSKLKTYYRDLLISSSRPVGNRFVATNPANLQGIWNPHVRPLWSSNYTIKTQMNHCPAEMSSLSEMHRPLFDLSGDVAVTREPTAGNFYGAHGWVAHHNTDIRGISNPVGDIGKGDPVWTNWPMGGAWLCRQPYDHPRYKGEQPFLREKAYPLMKGAAQFCLDWLIQDKKGYWVTSPSTTPENLFVTPNGEGGQVPVAITMEMSIIWDLLFGSHPGRQIAPLTTPELAAAARKTLALRGDGGTGRLRDCVARLAGRKNQQNRYPVNSWG